jgi:hypothetical protein
VWLSFVLTPGLIGRLLCQTNQTRQVFILCYSSQICKSSLKQTAEVLLSFCSHTRRFVLTVSFSVIYSFSFSLHFIPTFMWISSWMLFLLPYYNGSFFSIYLHRCVLVFWLWMTSCSHRVFRSSWRTTWNRRHVWRSHVKLHTHTHTHILVIRGEGTRRVWRTRSLQCLQAHCSFLVFASVDSVTNVKEVRRSRTQESINIYIYIYIYRALSVDRI